MHAFLAGRISGADKVPKMSALLDDFCPTRRAKAESKRKVVSEEQKNEMLYAALSGYSATLRKHKDD